MFACYESWKDLVLHGSRCWITRHELFNSIARVVFDCISIPVVEIECWSRPLCLIH